jgi:hypothetical protein
MAVKQIGFSCLSTGNLLCVDNAKSGLFPFFQNQHDFSQTI